MAVLPMFPLGSVLFPSLVLPLHIFEARYRALIADVLEGSGEFGVVLIEQGVEVGGGDTRHDVGTVARVVQAEQFDDGRWGVVAVGDRRIAVDAWLDDDPYPRAEVSDHPEPPPSEAVRPLADQVTRGVRSALAKASELGDAAQPATIECSDELQLLSFQLAAIAPVSTVDRQRLLAAPTAEDRLGLLHEQLADIHQLLDLRMADSASPYEG